MCEESDEGNEEKKADEENNNNNYLDKNEGKKFVKRKIYELLNLNN